MAKMTHLPLVVPPFFTGQMPFLPPNQQCQSTEGDGGGGHWLVQMEWRLAGWSVCLLLLIFLCTIKSRSSLLAPAHQVVPEKGPQNGCGYLWWLIVAVLNNPGMSNRTQVMLVVTKHLIEMESLSISDEKVSNMRRRLVANHFSNSSEISTILAYT